MKSKTCGITIHCGGNTRQQGCNVRMFVCTTIGLQVHMKLRNPWTIYFFLFFDWESPFEIAVSTSSMAFLAFWIMALAASALIMARPLSFIFMASSNKDIPSFSKASEFAFFLRKLSGCLPSASCLPLSSSAFLFSSFSFFFLS